MAGTYEEEVDAAILRVRTFDQIEGREDRSLKTILLALNAGLKHPESGAHFDALVMLADLISQPTR